MAGQSSFVSDGTLCQSPTTNNGTSGFVLPIISNSSGPVLRSPVRGKEIFHLQIIKKEDHLTGCRGVRGSPLSRIGPSCWSGLV